MAIISKLIEGLTNDVTYYARVYPINPEGFAQSELDGQVVSVVPMAGIALSTLAQGAVIMIKENGVDIPFYLAKHDYESDLNGAGRTLLVRKDAYNSQKWDTSNKNAYATSSLDKWLNSDYKSMLSAAVQEAIGETTFYYTMGGGNKTLTTLERSVFILSLSEFGKTPDSGNSEGSTLPTSNTLKVARLNGTATNQWTRSPYTSNSTNVHYVSSSGALNSRASVGSSYGVRPCFTLPADAKVYPTPNADGSYTLSV